MMSEAIFYTLAAWLSTCAAFVGIPVYFSIRSDARRADALGVPNARAIMRRRFFIPVAPSVSESLAGKAAWLDWSTCEPNSRDKRAVRVIAVDSDSLTLDNALTFRPKRASRAFASGAGAATGALFDANGERVGAGLLVFP